MYQTNLTSLALTQGIIDAEAKMLAEQQEILVLATGFNALGRTTKAELVTLARSIGENRLQTESPILLKHLLLEDLFGTVITHLIRILLLQRQ